MQRLTRLLLHKTRDKGGNSHNFAFDTMTKVYRDAVYVGQERYAGNPMYPERGADTTAASSSDVTNHVGGLGVMSAAGRAIEQEMRAELEQQAAEAAQRPRTLLKRRKGNKMSPFGKAEEGGEEGEEDTVSEAVRAADAKLERARTRRLTRKTSTSSGSGGEREGQRAKRHSGVQREVLGLYRQMLRESCKLRDAESAANLRRYIRAEFDKQKDVPRRDIMKIEWSINHAKRKLEDLQAMGPSTKFHVRM